LSSIEAMIHELEKHEEEYDKAITEHMERLHDYNSVKDVGQMLMGKLAEIEGEATRDMYKRYGLEETD